MSENIFVSLDRIAGGL